MAPETHEAKPQVFKELVNRMMHDFGPVLRYEFRDFIHGILNPKKEEESTEEYAQIVTRVLQKFAIAKPPRIALVGMTSAGKSSLINTLFGQKVADVKRTPDTTRTIFKIEFENGLIIYDTPGVGGNEEYENYTRMFLGLPQDPDLEMVDNIPYETLLDGTIEYLDEKQIPKIAKVDVVLFVIDASRTMTRFDRKLLSEFVLQLERKYQSQVTIVATHLDKLHELTEEERNHILKSIALTTNGQAIPVANPTSEGIPELVDHLFRSMPSGVNIAKLQEALVAERRLRRLPFVTTEISYILAELIQLEGNKLNAIRATTLLLFIRMYAHYSISEEDWEKHHGDIDALGAELPNFGQMSFFVERGPHGLWEQMQSWFGRKFHESASVTVPVGIEGLRMILPTVYQHLHNLVQPEYELIPDNYINEWVDYYAYEMGRAIDFRHTTTIAHCIHDTLNNLIYPNVHQEEGEPI